VVLSDTPKPFVFVEAPDAKRFAPATQRNRDPIVSVLRDVLPDKGQIIEIASGTGEHVVHFAAYFPHLIWQPTDFDPAGLSSIAAWAAECRLPNILHPLKLDAAESEWPVKQADGIVCINMVHISPWSATEGLFAGAKTLLSGGAPLFLYGPFREDKVPTVPSNEAFDASLRAANTDWGLRIVEDVANIAETQGFTLERRVPMPANNMSLIFRRH
jgi:Protein of unknown function (DUF938)